MLSRQGQSDKVTARRSFSDKERPQLLLSPAWQINDLVSVRSYKETEVLLELESKTHAGMQSHQKIAEITQREGRGQATTVRDSAAG